ncbi:GTPase ObgE [Candidatus Acetothermia bacterium]|jgi:GTP-binding protein|nr:GTPase ObgE [Candidatus Acetothermia bacterium]MCI2427204.1 GTPase ObgE [Candidatus Acetothermia bacterium]
MFIDEAKIHVQAGRGGNGIICFYSYKGGPAGGNGGNGGDIVIQASPHITTLSSFKDQRRFRGKDGQPGGKNKRQGYSGDDTIIHVPIGTVVRDSVTGEILADLSHSGAEILLARGGEGGRGNASFVTSVRQAPRICERGLPGEQRSIDLELKLLADVGIIGFPNVGKSSLISAISARKAKIAPYPFTTVVPNLGVVDVDGINQFVAVDIPGLIEGAHAGKGLGDKFLKHIERTRVLIHIVDITALERDDPLDDYMRINAELSAFNSRLADKPQLVVGNKIDLVDEKRVDEVCMRFKEQGIDLLPISVVTGANVRNLVKQTYYLLATMRERESIQVTRRRIYRSQGDVASVTVRRDEEKFVVSGEKVEKLVTKLVLDSRDAHAYLYEQLEKMGVIQKLVKAGYKDGDRLVIGEMEFETMEICDGGA